MANNRFVVVATIDILNSVASLFYIAYCRFCSVKENEDGDGKGDIELEMGRKLGRGGERW